VEELKPAAESAVRALTSFESIFSEPYSVIVRDAAIQRFEFTFEAVWKYLKTYLSIREGIVCASPKSCFRHAFQVELMDEDQTVTALEMVDDRNRTVHTYHEEVARAIWERLPGYLGIMKLLVERMAHTDASP